MLRVLDRRKRNIYNMNSQNLTYGWVTSNCPTWLMQQFYIRRFISFTSINYNVSTVCSIGSMTCHSSIHTVVLKSATGRTKNDYTGNNIMMYTLHSDADLRKLHFCVQNSDHHHRVAKSLTYYLFIKLNRMITTQNPLHNVFHHLINSRTLIVFIIKKFVVYWRNFFMSKRLEAFNQWSNFLLGHFTTYFLDRLLHTVCCHSPVLKITDAIKFAYSLLVTPFVD